MNIAKILDRAVYVDFEGVPGEPPALMGIHRAGKHTLVSLDHRLDRAVLAVRGEIATLEGSLERLRELTEAGHSIICFTEHERRIFNEFGWRPEGLAYVDAHKILRRMSRQLGYLGPYNLASFESLFGYQRDYDTGPHEVASTIRDLRLFIRGKEFSELEPTTRIRWLRLCHHNLHDCRSLEYMLRRLASCVEVLRPTAA